jgi:hypothetical protein
MAPIILYAIGGAVVGAIALFRGKIPEVNEHIDAELEAEIIAAKANDICTLRGWWYNPPKDKSKTGEYIPSVKRLAPSKLILDGTRRTVDGCLVFRVIDETSPAQKGVPALPFYVNKRTYESLKKICCNSIIL